MCRISKKLKVPNLSSEHYMWQRGKLTLIIFSSVLFTAQKGKQNTMSTTGVSIYSFQTPEIPSVAITVLKITQHSTLERLK